MDEKSAPGLRFGRKWDVSLIVNKTHKLGDAAAKVIDLLEKMPSVSLK